MFSIKDYINGAIGGMVGLTMSHPIDTIKNNIQVGNKINWSFRALYKGFVSPFFGMGIEKAIVFGTYEMVYNYLLEKNKWELCYKNIAMAGAISGMAASIVVTPIERIKILKQTNKDFSLSYKSINIRYLYTGFSSTLTRETPGFAIYFSSYNYFKNQYIDYMTHEPTIPYYFVTGGLSGLIAWAFIYPQDVIKTNIQSTNNLTFNRVVKNIYTTEGLKGFYKGFHFAVMRAFPLHAGTFTIIELLKKY